MAKSETVFLAIGGGEMADAPEILDEIFRYLQDRTDPRMVVMTVATNHEEDAKKKYDPLFRRKGVHHVEMVNVSERPDAFSETSVKKVASADAIFFTGGDQQYVTALLGGSPVDLTMKERIKDGILLAGTSAGAAMMSGAMIIGGDGATAPRAGGVKLGPGMNLIPDTIIDTHFSQRGRHGRLLTAIAHDPQLLGIGIDERTAMRLQGRAMRVLGNGCVTAMDGRKVTHTDLVDKGDDRPVGILDVCLHVLPAGYSFDIAARTPRAPAARAAY
jgi:cyanophycinase